MFWWPLSTSAAISKATILACCVTVTAVGHKVNIMRLFEIILGNGIEFSLSIMCWRMLRMDLWVTRDKLSFMCEIDVFGLLFKHFPKPLEIFADPLKALIKPLNDLKSHLSAISFCLFHGNVSVYIFLEKVTFFSKMLGFTVVKIRSKFRVSAYSQDLLIAEKIRYISYLSHSTVYKHWSWLVSHQATSVWDLRYGPVFCSCSPLHSIKYITHPTSLGWDFLRGP